MMIVSLSGAPIVPVFCARTGHREYLVHVSEGIDVPRRADDATGSVP